ncbi:HK97-gp10 family putative phage morphogenesis protein [Sporolactobacillus terrae]|uniref:HK97-gp10 family putative phage morphogenesis protein n=1 Tax=Sporolactobacillus terrae TaxID=269673 RepID=UPI000686B355|nr:HK97-gp10 family putative phage morphogenesis protein [Sporolactobacillus terrae]
MAKARITYGDKGFELAVKQFEKQYINEVKKVVAETAELMVSQAKALAPVDLGNLRSSIDVAYSNDGLTAVISVGAEYAVYCEYGTGIYSTSGSGRKTPWVYWSDKLGRYVMTRGMRAQPFFTPAFESAAKYFNSAMNKLG